MFSEIFVCSKKVHKAKKILVWWLVKIKTASAPTTQKLPACQRKQQNFNNALSLPCLFTLFSDTRKAIKMVYFNFEHCYRWLLHQKQGFITGDLRGNLSCIWSPSLIKYIFSIFFLSNYSEIRLCLRVCTTFSKDYCLYSLQCLHFCY